MKDTVLEMQFATLFSGTECTKVLGRFGYDRSKELHLHTLLGFVTNLDIHKDSGMWDTFGIFHHIRDR